jgi:hypothetical protein
MHLFANVSAQKTAAAAAADIDITWSTYFVHLLLQVRDTFSTTSSDRNQPLHCRVMHGHYAAVVILLKSNSRMVF